MNRNALYFVGGLALLYLVMTYTSFWQSTSVWTHVRTVQEPGGRDGGRVTLRATEAACLYSGTVRVVKHGVGLLDRLTTKLSFGRATPWYLSMTRATCFSDDGQLTHEAVRLAATGLGRLKQGDLVILAPAESGHELR